MRTDQQLYDEIIQHLRTQQQRSVAPAEWNGAIRCMYHSQEGLKCSIVYLINSVDYKPEMEGKTLDQLLASNLLSDPLQQEIETHRLLLRELQLTHDMIEVDSWEERFQKIATNFNLTYKIP